MHLAPLAAWGIWRRRRWGRLLALVIAWSTWISVPVLVAVKALGPHTLGNAITVVWDPVGSVALAFATVLLAWSHLVLRRPEARAAFPPRPFAPWRPWQSLAAIAGIMVVSQVVAGFVIATHLDAPASDSKSVLGLLGNGTILTAITCVTAPLTVVLIVACVLLRGDRPSAALALRPVSARAMLAALGAAIALAAGAGALAALFDHQQPEFVLSVYRTAESRPLLWLAIVVLAPLSEELLFRGLLLGDLVRAGLGTTTIVVLTSAAFMGLHVAQYAPWDLAYLFALGSLLALARAQSDSIYPPIAMHALVNGAAMLAVALTVP